MRMAEFSRAIIYIYIYIYSEYSKTVMAARTPDGFAQVATLMTLKH